MRAIELNGCSGGMAKGMRDAGIEFSWCFDWDADACASYEQNLGHRPIKMDIRDVVRMVRGGWSPGPLDLLVADPPCTPWSRAGKRQGTADERDMLEETCDLIALLRPRAFLIGNVPGLQDSTSWHVVQRVIGGLAKHGYCCADYKQLDAASYGVPQRRIRPFWFGHLAGPCLVWPAPSHTAPSPNLNLAALGLKPWVTCREALGHLPAEEMGRPVRLRRQRCNTGECLNPYDCNHGRRHPSSILDSPAHGIKGAARDDGGTTLILNERHAPAMADAPAPTMAAKVRGQGAQVLRVSDPNRPPTPLDQPHRTISVGGRDRELIAASHAHPTSKADQPAWVITSEGGRAGKRSSVLEGMRPSQGVRTGVPDEPSATVDCKTDRIGAGAGHVIDWPWDRAATTVARDERIPPPGHHDANSYLSTPNAIVLSERAAAILQGFPEGWVFVGKTKRSRWSQLGQAMPPALAAAVGRSIVRQVAAAAAETRGNMLGVAPDALRGRI